MNDHITSATAYNIKSAILGFLRPREGHAAPRGQIVTFLVKNGYPNELASNCIDMLIYVGVLEANIDSKTNMLIITPDNRNYEGGDHV